jgi:hypothetical protein
MATLYEINADINRVIEEGVDPDTGEITPETERKLLDLEFSKEIKLENIALYAKNLESDAKAIDEEIKALQARKKTKMNRAAWLKRVLAGELNGEKMETPRVKISWRKSERLVIDVPDTELPAIWKKNYRVRDLIKKVEVYNLDKTATKKAIKEGRNIPFAKVEIHNNIQIK